MALTGNIHNLVPHLSRPFLALPVVSSNTYYLDVAVTVAVTVIYVTLGDVVGGRTVMVVMMVLVIIGPDALVLLATHCE
jgi:hypothetical protein